jgi:hypothetical protein
MDFYVDLPKAGYKAGFTSQKENPVPNVLAEEKREKGK